MISEKVLLNEIKMVKKEIKKYLKLGDISLAAEQYHTLNALEFVRDYDGD